MLIGHYLALAEAEREARTEAGHRARPHRRIVPPRIHFIIYTRFVNMLGAAVSDAATRPPQADIAHGLVGLVHETTVRSLKPF